MTSHLVSSQRRGCVHISHALVMRITFFTLRDAYYLETLLLRSGWTTVMYSETQNENGTYNTRCLYCFMTVATAVETKEELEHVEAQHVCPERALSELLAAKAATEPQTDRN